MADFAGKDRNTDGWSIDDVSLNTLELVAGEKFTCDVFAHSSNQRCKKFYSKLPSFGTAGVNAYTMDWSGDFNFVCPPLKEITFVVRHIKDHKCTGVLVIPHLPSARFWHGLVNEDRKFLPFIKKTFVFRPDLYPGFNCPTSSFSGPYQQHNKQFIALYFDSRS